MYTLYGGKGSGSAAVEAALEFTGARFRIVNAPTWANDPGIDEAANCYAAGGISAIAAAHACHWEPARG